MQQEGSAALSIDLLTFQPTGANCHAPRPRSTVTVAASNITPTAGAHPPEHSWTTSSGLPHLQSTLEQAGTVAATHHAVAAIHKGLMGVRSGCSVTRHRVVLALLKFILNT